MSSRGLYSLVLSSLAIGASGHGAGIWMDPNHYEPTANSLGGIRIIAEENHKLTMVGTNDGKEWWKLEGSCSGEGMTEINFDFSPVGGPVLTGTWAHTDGKPTTITWPDGNVWSMLGAPTAAWAQPTPIDDHVGLFTDPNHYTSSATFAGTRYFAEFPPHQLTVIGTDEEPDPVFGKSMWVVRGNCTGADMTHINLDFSPKGGPAFFSGTWTAAADLSEGKPGQIAWPDGNVWTMKGPVPAASVSAQKVELLVPDDVVIGTPAHNGLSAFLAAVVIAAVAAVAYRSYAPAERGSGGPQRFSDDDL